MKRTIDYLITGIIGLLGAVHIALTPMFYERMNEEANIFIGMGLAFIFLGALNFSRLLAKHKSVTVVGLACNLIAVGYLTYFEAMSGKIEPQFVVTIIVVFSATVFSILQLKNQK